MPNAGSMRFAPTALSQIDEWIDRYRRYWAGHLDALERHLGSHARGREMTERPRPTDRLRRSRGADLRAQAAVSRRDGVDGDHRSRSSARSGSARRPSTPARAARSTWWPPVPRCPSRRKRMTGRILVWDPPRVLEHEWKQPIVEDGVVRYELHPDGDGTLLRFSHRGLGVPQCVGFPGWHARLSRPPRGVPRRRRTARLGPHGARKSLEHTWSRINMSHNGSHIAAPTVAVAYHSGFGHTAVLADAVAAGARDGGAHVTVVAVDAHDRRRLGHPRRRRRRSCSAARRTWATCRRHFRHSPSRPVGDA